jgi:hypothetical protein
LTYTCLYIYEYIFNASGISLYDSICTPKKLNPGSLFIAFYKIISKQIATEHVTKNQYIQSEIRIPFASDFELLALVVTVIGLSTLVLLFVVDAFMVPMLILGVVLKMLAASAVNPKAELVLADLLVDVVPESLV